MSVAAIVLAIVLTTGASSCTDHSTEFADSVTALHEPPPLRPQPPIVHRGAGSTGNTLEQLNFDKPVGALPNIALELLSKRSSSNHTDNQIWRVKTPLRWDADTTRSTRQVYNATVSHIVPVAVSEAKYGQPTLVVSNTDVFELLNLDRAEVHRPKFVQVLE